MVLWREHSPGFDSQTRRHMWVDFLGSIRCSERFLPRDSAGKLDTNI